jgi:glutathione S-transferase
MKLHVAPRAPNPRRVTIFMAEKGITHIELVNVDLNGKQHQTPEYLALSPFAKMPVLVLDDGRALSESRAICTYLEGLHPEPNLMGRSAEERAFIEMTDRQCT